MLSSSGVALAVRAGALEDRSPMLRGGCDSHDGVADRRGDDDRIAADRVLCVWRLV